MNGWKYDPETLGVNIGNKKLRFVNRVHPTQSREKEAEERAQIAQLVAAARELAEMLDWVQNYCPVEVQDRIRALLVKAGWRSE